MKKILLLTLCVALFACTSDEMDGPNKDQGGQAAPGGSNSQTLVKGPVSVTFGELTSSTAAFSSILDIANIDEYKEVGLLWSGYSEFDIETEGVAKVQITKENFEEELTGLRWIQPIITQSTCNDIMVFISMVKSSHSRQKI